MKWNCCFPAHRATLKSMRSARPARAHRFTLSLAIATAAILFLGSPLPSLGDTLPPNTSVYMYTSGGLEVDVTDQVFFVGSQAYVYPSDPVAITLDYSDGHVLDPNGADVGFIVTGGDNPNPGG